MAALNTSGGGSSGEHFFEFIDKLNKNSLELLKRAQPSKVESKVLISSRKSKGSPSG